MKIESVELNHDGIQELLQSEDMQSVLTEIASSRARLGSGNYEVSCTVRPTRAVAKISCADAKTYYKNLKTNELIQLIKGGGG